MEYNRNLFFGTPKRRKMMMFHIQNLSAKLVFFLKKTSPYPSSLILDSYVSGSRSFTRNLSKLFDSIVSIQTAEDFILILSA
uniref:Uncharacterized protein n=1 Tax=Lepeophtheirus salmonis TaxID=72036 RepID=A0A0K2U4W2_LEPSM